MSLAVFCVIALCPLPTGVRCVSVDYRAPSTVEEFLRGHLAVWSLDPSLLHFLDPSCAQSPFPPPVHGVVGDLHEVGGCSSS